MESEDESTSSGSTVEDEQVTGPSTQAVDFGAAEYVLPESESNEIYMNSESADESEGSDSEEEADERRGGSDEAVHSNSQGEENSDKELSDSENEDVQWDWTSTSNYQATVENFDDTTSGLRHRMDEFSSPLDIFRTVFNDEAMDLVVSETNRYADQTGDCLTKRWEKWRSVDSTEMMRFFAVRMLMGINNKPELSHYWSRDPIFRQTLIPEIMSRDRYFEISRNLHFSNNDDQPPGDRLFKINAIWGLVMKHFSSLIEPGEKLSVDESLILYKGRLHFKQYIPSKRSRFGVKTFTIVDEKTKFLINSIIYSGKGHLLKYSKKEFGYGGAIALELVSPYLNSNRRLYCDNWFTSPLLAMRLLDKKTYMCGTLRKTRKDAPKVSGKMKKGEVEAYHSNGVLVEFWRDKKIVRMISTANDHRLVDIPSKNGGAAVSKPSSVLDYNQKARGIDQSDQLMKFYSLKRKSLKWYKKIFFHLLDMCMYNSFIIYKTLHGKTSFLDFKMLLIRSILEDCGCNTRKSGPRPKNNPLRLSGKHFLSYNPQTKSRNHGQRDCVVCSNTVLAGKRKRAATVYQCSTCNVPLCPVGCFERYHSVIYY